MIKEDFESTEESRILGSATATVEEIADVGGEKTLIITNHLFQDETETQAMAEALLALKKGRKKYFKIKSEFCPVPIEPGDVIAIQERITNTYWTKYPYGDSTKKYGDSSRLYRSNGIVLVHAGIVRDIKISVTPSSQTLELSVEV